MKALGSGHESFQFFNQTNPIKFSAYDTNNLLPLLVRNESSPLRISFAAVALDFQVFLAQTIRLKRSNSKESALMARISLVLKINLRVLELFYRESIL